MKILASALLLSSGALAFSQAPPRAPVNPDWLSQLGQPDATTRKGWSPKVPDTAPTPWLAQHAPKKRLRGTKIDPKFILRPPKWSFAQQQSKPPVVQGLYPDLQLLPVQTAGVSKEPIGQLPAAGEIPAAGGLRP